METHTGAGAALAKETELPPSVSTTNVVEDAITAAKRTAELREAAIKTLRAQREEIDRNMELLNSFAMPTDVVRQASSRQPANGHAAGISESPERNEVRTRFRNLNVSDAVRILLEEHSTLHGREIERLIKVGGYKVTGSGFQNYLPVALRRAGGFENTGRNNWRLNDKVEAVRQ